MICKLFPISLGLALACWAAMPWTAAAVASGTADEAAAADATAEIPRLVERLASDDFTTRTQAQARLEAVVALEGRRADVKAELRRIWLSPELAVEARALLEPICGQVPEVLATVGDADGQRLDRLIGQLESLNYAQREAAALELERLAGRMPAALALVERLKQALDKPGTSLDARRQMDALWRRARGTWLLAPEQAAAAPKVEARQIEAWIDALNASDVAPAAEKLRAENAQRKLLDLLARDEYVARVKQALEKRLEAEPGEAARSRITTLVGWTWPAMVAEY
ncbi:MAG TPA: hypothetical protein VHY20_02300, partial [Pirellulales bacterium]|nr:hypothetical protein [Pirellulales bacterium]